ncbi:MAG: acetamidase/formamidase family protein, partial [Alphaproteobacteria bacterium]|nr:acetamidase/formamidase family protein [Alphaproteobacteria bacterium]
MKEIRIDRKKRLKDEPQTGHNRWHPDIPAIIEVAQGEELVLETRDARDGQIGPGTTEAELATHDQKSGHPLTGPIRINDAKPGDLLEIEYLDIVPESFGWTRFRPGIGFLRDHFPDPYLVLWNMEEGWATSPLIPGVRIPEGSFMG